MARWRTSMEALLRERERDLVGYAFLISGDAARTGDLVKDSLVRVFTRHGGIGEPSAAERLVRREIVSIYLHREARRRRWRALKQLTEPHDWVAEPLGDHSDDPVAEVLFTLPPIERVCLILHALDNLTVAQVSEETSVPPERVRTYLRDGIRRIGNRLEPLDEIDFDSAPVTDLG
jgi:RNA polymerase sigma factor (sigma-70 family)